MFIMIMCLVDSSDKCDHKVCLDSFKLSRPTRDLALLGNGAYVTWEVDDYITEDKLSIAKVSPSESKQSDPIGKAEYSFRLQSEGCLFDRRPH